MNRPQNCGTGFCSCIECLYKPFDEMDEHDLRVIQAKTLDRLTAETRLLTKLVNERAEVIENLRWQVDAIQGQLNLLDNGTE